MKWECERSSWQMLKKENTFPSSSQEQMPVFWNNCYITWGNMNFHSQTRFYCQSTGICVGTKQLLFALSGIVKAPLYFHLARIWCCCNRIYWCCIKPLKDWRLVLGCDLSTHLPFLHLDPSFWWMAIAWPPETWAIAINTKTPYLKCFLFVWKALYSCLLLLQVTLKYHVIMAFIMHFIIIFRRWV